MQSRFLQLQKWLKQIFNHYEGEICPLAKDASFRRYYRIFVEGISYIVMDAPLAYERPDVFYHLAKTLKSYGLRVPNCYAYQKSQGFLVLDDFGDTQLFHLADTKKNTAFYDKALAILTQFWKINTRIFPSYPDKKIDDEMDLMPEWFLPFIGREISGEATYVQTYTRLKALLLENIHLQPKVFVHLDFHSKNIMYDNGHYGIIDFQDAVKGPISYDLVSILRDCYVTLPDAFIKTKLNEYRQTAIKMKCIDEETSLTTWQKWFDWTGLQRHLKCLGIFTRQSLKNGRDDYLVYLPRVTAYIDKVLENYSEFRDFRDLWKTHLKPACDQKLATLPIFHHSLIHDTLPR